MPSQLSGFQLFVISHVNFMVNGILESVPRGHVFPFLDVYHSLLLQKSSLFHPSFIHKNCSELFLPAIFFILDILNWNLMFTVCRKRDSKAVYC